MATPDIKAVCFDVFGTLISYGGQRTNPYSQLLRVARGDGPPLPFLTRNVPVDVFAHELDASYILPSIRQDLAAEIDGLRLFGEVPMILEQLHAQGLKIAACSNLAYEYGDAVRRLLLGLDAYIFSYEVGVAKPEPAIYRAVCGALGMTPDKVLFIGDSKRCDVDGPKRFGMHANWLDRRGGQSLLEVI